MKEARLGWSLKRIVYDGIEARGKRWARVKSLIEGLETRLGGQLAYNGAQGVNVTTTYVHFSSSSGLTNGTRSSSVDQPLSNSPVAWVRSDRRVRRRRGVSGQLVPRFRRSNKSRPSLWPKPHTQHAPAQMAAYSVVL